MDPDFRENLSGCAKRAAELAHRCTNEESTKLFLVLPFLNFFGYNDRDPREVAPEHGADFSDKYKNRVDYAILKNDEPIIAIECKTVNSELKDDRGQLRSYFNAAHSVKMGVLTDGLVYEFYADSDEPNLMDPNAFLAFDLREIAEGKIEDSVLEGLAGLRKTQFDPDNIGAEAKRKLVFRSVVKRIQDLASEPDDTFTRMLLQDVGVKHVRSKALGEYKDLVRSAFAEFINLQILSRLDLPRETKTEIARDQDAVTIVETKDNVPIVTTETEMNVFYWTRRRLSFLLKDADSFNKIESIRYRDYIGKFVVFYKQERKGRLFEFEGGKSGDSIYHFRFAPDGVELHTNELEKIDEHLLSVFNRRVSELG